METVRKLAKFLKPYWHWAMLAPLLMVLEVAMDLMQPRLIQRIVDVGIAQRDMQVVISTGLLMIGLALDRRGSAGWAAPSFRRWPRWALAPTCASTLFAKVQSLSFGNLDELETGQLVTRLTNDVTQIEQMVSMMLRIMVRAPLDADRQPGHGDRHQPAPGLDVAGVWCRWCWRSSWSLSSTRPTRCSSASRSGSTI